MKMEEFRAKVNQDPKIYHKAEFIKSRQVGGGKTTLYIVAPKNKGTFEEIFGDFDEEILSVEYIKNEITRSGKKKERIEVVVRVRLSVTHPVTGKPMFKDGLGSANNQGGSLELQSVVPNAEQYAFNDARKKFGRIFGRDLNKDADEAYTPDFTPEEKEQGFVDLCNAEYKTLAEFQKAVPGHVYESVKTNSKCVAAYVAKGAALKVAAFTEVLDWDFTSTEDFLGVVPYLAVSKLQNSDLLIKWWLVKVSLIGEDEAAKKLAWGALSESDKLTITAHYNASKKA